MANLVPFTEQINDPAWLKSGNPIVTSNTHPAPAFAGLLADGADTIEDADLGNQATVVSAYQAVVNDASAYVTSLYVRKDAITTRWPDIGMEFANGTPVIAAVNLNTATGTLANSTLGAPEASGVIDVDDTWWRVWLRKANNNTGNTLLRVVLYPSRAASLGGSASNASVGSVVVWGANQTNTATVQPYAPDPFYEYGADWVTVATLSNTATAFTDMTMLGGYPYDYRVVAVNAGGVAVSNIATVFVSAAGPAWGVSRRAGHHTRRAVFRTRRV